MRNRLSLLVLLIGLFSGFEVWAGNCSSNAGQTVFGVMPEARAERGYQVNVQLGTLAEEMGLQSKDVIININTSAINRWSDITGTLADLQPEDPITITLLREGTLLTVSYPCFSRNTVSNEACEGVEKAFLGIHKEHVSREKAKWLGYDNPNGTYVSKVLPGTAAEKAGIRIFDYLIGLDEYRVGEDQDLGDILSRYQPGDRAQIHLVRKKQRLTLPITLGERSDVVEVRTHRCDEPFFGVEQRHNSSSNSVGVSIAVVDNSTAQDMGLTSGSRIIEINGQSLYDWTDLSIAINSLDAGDEINVLWEDTNGQRQREVRSIKSYGATKDCDGGRQSKRFSLHLDFDNVVEDICREVEIAVEEAIESIDGRPGNSRRRNGEGTIPEALPLSEVSVVMEDMDREEVDQMRQRGFDMPYTSDLTVEALELYPNPTMGRFNLQFNLPGKGRTSIRVLNSLGREIYFFDIGEFTGDFNDTIDLSQNGPGAYFLQVNQNGRALVKKVLLQRG